jgi:hypothetical protein
MTTIKVPKALRERISAEAARAGLTAAGLVNVLLAEHERRMRVEAVRRSYDLADETYRLETVAWDELAGDGLGR